MYTMASTGKRLGYLLYGYVLCTASFVLVWQAAIVSSHPKCACILLSQSLCFFLGLQIVPRTLVGLVLCKQGAFTSSSEVFFCLPTAWQLLSNC